MIYEDFFNERGCPTACADLCKARCMKKDTTASMPKFYTQIIL